MHNPLMSPEPLLADGPANPQREQNQRAAVLMVLSTATIVCNDTIMKLVTETVPLYQAVVMRGIFILPLMMLYARRQGGLKLRLAPRDFAAVLLRSVFEVSSTILYLYALRRMALADLSAIFQSLPLLVTLAAAVVFREKLGRRRLAAIFVGFLGMLIILRPGSSAFDIWALAVLASVILIVGRDLTSRVVSPRVSSTTIAFYAAGSVTLFGLAMLPTESWQPMTAGEVGLMALAAGFIAVSYVAAIATVRIGEISFVAPFRYTALVWAIIMGAVVFGKWPDVWTQTGAVLIVGAGLYSIWREARIARES
ncbi:DMT family transporter [Paracoccus aminophilus]|uniref:S-adenosylmethionine uptake transporter n=1 Tax=Paracoccus aminophilus JCM 7686 TaxID=1367847 RepID=S5XS26_PARAH|nr:DMT family transporter [Paracoccus aminophilus]AGT10254.1 S-adenosylmethionine uptake transporter [Paracoccus aminophilus JCM 7686]